MRKKLKSAVFILCIVLLSVGATLIVQRLLGSGAGLKSASTETETDALQALRFLESEAPAGTETGSDDRDAAVLAQAQALDEQVLQAQRVAQAARVDEAVREQAGSWLQLVDGSGLGVSGRVLVGAPGLWPYETLGTNGDGLVRLPSVAVTTLANRAVYHYELLARSDDLARPMAFWGEYNSLPPTAFEGGLVEEAKLAMVAAADVRFRVVDENDKPVMGAFVRLSRDSVGLLHLTFTTGPDGLVVFSRLPPDTYSVTLNAEGFGRTVFDIAHDLEAEEHVVELGEGAGFRRPSSWRQNPDVAPKPSTVTSPALAENTGSGPGESSVGDAEAGEVEIPAARARRLQIFVVDDYGAPVVGAYVEMWAGDTRLASGASKGHEALELGVGGNAGRLIAIYPGMGEGELSVPAGGEEGEADVERIITLNMPLFSSGAVPGRVHSVAQVEDALGVELVDMDSAWLLDVLEPGQLAERGGLLRGDSLLSLRRTTTGYEAVVNRRGQIRRVVL